MESLNSVCLMLEDPIILDPGCGTDGPHLTQSHHLGKVSFPQCKNARKKKQVYMHMCIAWGHVQACVHVCGGLRGCQALLSCSPLYLLRQYLLLKSELTKSAYLNISVCPRSLLSERWDYRLSPCLPGIYIDPGDASSCPHACGADT